MKRLTLLALTLSGCSSSPTPLRVSWAADYFPLADGNVWVYQETLRRGGVEKEQLRVKTALRHREEVFALQDPDSDDYLFASTAEGLFLHGELKPSGKEVAFQPPLEYASPRLFDSGEWRATHEGEGRTIESTARLLGVRKVRVPALAGEQDGVATAFEYVTPDRKRFAVENVFIRGVGPVERSFRLSGEDGKEIFATRHVLIAARVAGRAHPDSAGLAKLAFRHAFEHRETWSSDFRGFRARVTLAIGGAKIGDFSLHVDGTARILELVIPPEATEHGAWVRRTLESMLDHRRRRDFDAQHGRDVFALEPAEGAALGVGIRGDSMGSRYEVLGGVVRSVSRLDERGRRFRIDVRDVTWTPRSRYLATRFEVRFFDESLHVRERLELADEFTQVEEHFLPSRRTVTSGSEVRELRFEEIRPN